MSSHSQVCRKTSAAPAPRSLSMLVRVSGAGRAATRMRPKQTAATAYVAESIAIAQPDPNAATSTPATEKPTTWAEFWQSRRPATAVARSAGGTVCRVIAEDEGPASAPRQPLAMPITVSIGIEAQPPISATATTPWVRNAAADDPCIITWRGSRSPSTPPNSTVTTSASAYAATTRPRSVADPPRSRTANASATGAIEPPRLLTVAPETSSR